MIALMSGLRDWISHRMGWETYDEAYARIATEIERDFPRMTAEERRLQDEMAAIAKEVIRRRLDGPDGEYERGIEGLQ
jgi:hypothetical protein